MAKERREQSRQWSVIHLVEGTPENTYTESEMGQSCAVYKRSAQEKSRMAMRYVTAATRSRRPSEFKGLSMVSPATVLKELFELLEDYSPVWYTEETTIVQ